MVKDIVYTETLYSKLTTLNNKPVRMYTKQIKKKPIKKKAIRIAKFEIYKDKAGEYRFRLKAPNGEIIAVSEGYRSKKSCMSGIQSVKKNVLKPKIVEL
ncbi:Uncharacterised protein [uncultured archaeon]|nr:Uncharacterised protein [uncultured archaeon]